MRQLNEIINDRSTTENENSKPLLVGTNITLNYDASIDNNLTYDTQSEPLAVGTNLTIEVTYAEAKLLEEQLGINLDGSDNYIGSNITVIDDNRDWLERIDNNPLYNQQMSSTSESVDYSHSWDWEEAEEITTEDDNNAGESATNFNFSSDSNEPLLVGTNITFVIKDTDGNSKTTDNPSLYERDEKTPFALGTNLLIELPDEDSTGNYLGTNLSTIGENNNATEKDFLQNNMISTESTDTTKSDNNNYAWDFSGQVSGFTGNSSQGMGKNMDLDTLFAASPWGALTETGAVDGFEDVFPNAVGEENPFAGGFGGK